MLYRTLPFYSWFYTNITAWVDVFNHNVNRMPGSLQTCSGYFFSQPSLVGVVLAHMSKCKARAVIVVPNTRASWFPMIEGAGVRSVKIVSKGENSQFLRVHHQRGAEPYTLCQDNHAHHRYTQHPRIDKQTHIRTVRSVNTSRSLTAESEHAAHNDHGHHARPFLTSAYYVKIQSMNSMKYMITTLTPHQNPDTRIRHLRQSPMFNMLRRQR